MIWIALTVALLAWVPALLAHREAVRSANRKLVGRVNEALDELEVAVKKIKRDWEEERDRLVKQARRTGAVANRLEKLMDEGEESAEGDEGGDAGPGNAPGLAAQPMQPLPGRMAQIPWRGGRTG